MKTRLLLLFLAGVISVSAQDVFQREKQLFERGLQDYKNKNYKAAEQNFATVVSRLPNNSFLTANYLMLVKAQYKLEDYAAALNTAGTFLENYPDSKYVKDVLAASGDCYYRLKRYETAIDYWLRAIRQSGNNTLSELTVPKVLGSAVTFLSTEDLSRLESQWTDPDGKIVLAFARAWQNRSSIDSQNYFSGLNQLLEKHPESVFSAIALRMLAFEKVGNLNVFRVALLLPLSGSNKDIGEQILEGVKFASDKFNQTSTVKIELVPKDYGQEISRAVQTFKSLAQDHTISAVYGPVENDIAAGCAAISEYEKLPLFSPTATLDELTEISKYFYQLNNPLKLNAKALAVYASDSLNIKRIATVAPIDNHFVRLVEDFSQTAEELGVEIVSQQWYYPGEQDLYKHFMRIKRIGLKLEFTDSLIAAFPEIDSISIDTSYQGYISRERKKILETNARVDSADIPVHSIGGLFVPIYSEDFQFIAPQIAYSNIQSQLLGNNDWYDPDQLKKNQSYLNGLIFTTDGYRDENNWDYKKFRNDYRTALGKTPTTWNMIGYDTFSFMIQGLKNTSSVPSRSDFLKMLEANPEYNGIFKDIKLDENNSNQSIPLLQYLYNQIVQIN